MVAFGFVLIVPAAPVVPVVTGAVFQSVQDHQLDLHPGDAAAAFADALADSTWVIVGLVAIGTVLTWALVRRPEGSPHPQPAEHEPHRLQRGHQHL